MMKEISLREMQQIELNILQVFDGLCRRHGLRYYMDGGTLLGAMCYEGFIPWDDDIDLKMPRPDYEKLLTLRGELPEYIDLEMPEDNGFEYLFTKLTDNRTLLREYGNGKVKETGVYLDIFPMDGHPADDKVRERHLKKLQRYNSLFHASLSGFESMKNASDPVTKAKGMLYSAIYSPKRLYGLLNKTAKKFSYDNSSRVGLLIEGNPIKECFEKSWLEPVQMLEFEGNLYPAPNGYKQHMVIFYGDHVVKPECYHNLPQYPSQHNHEVFWRREET